MKSNRGFTLVEILVVVALIALVMVFALPKVSNVLKVNLNSITLKIATTVQEAHNSTMVTGNIHRVVYDLEKNQFWVESGPKGVLLDSEKSRELDEERRRFINNTDEAPPPPQFSLEESITRRKIDLPTGVRFTDVSTEQSKEPFTVGEAKTHFFPNGLAEQTIIRLEDTENHQISLVIDPLIGKTTVFKRHVDQNEILGR